MNTPSGLGSGLSSMTLCALMAVASVASALPPPRSGSREAIASRATRTSFTLGAHSREVAPIGAPLDGPALYTQYCSSCHATGKKGTSVASIQAAIKGDKGGMGSLKSLTPAQIAAIAAAK
jgi:mono/diheme cytochrome c family protein